MSHRSGLSRLIGPAGGIGLVLAVRTALLSGKPVTFLSAVFVVVLWAITGPIFHYSDTWLAIRSMQCLRT